MERSLSESSLYVFMNEADYKRDDSVNIMFIYSEC